MSIYNVPVIPLNLRKEETIIQIAESLNYLAVVSEDILNLINNRLDKNAQYLKSLDTRMDKLSEKIMKISGAKKAIQVFSSSKYPAAELNASYRTVFDNENVPKKPKFPIKYQDIPVIDEPLESLQFYHLTFDNKNKSNYEGLGQIPKNHVNNTNDLLLYNTGRNLYNKYVISDILNMLQTVRKEVTNEVPEIAAAPLSISVPGMVSKHTDENYFYSPHLGNVPTIDVPIDLPDLPGIADNLRYVDKSNSVIAPSVVTSPNVPELPEIIPEPPEPSIELSEPIKTIPPPPEPPKPIQRAITPEPENVEIKETLPEEPPPKPAVPDVHASLMDAIRKAGGTKNLKTVEPLKEIEAKKTGGGDLMADLHSKLLMRRKGISGTEKMNSSDPASAMEKVSAMLPPPPPKGDQSEVEISDDDWDD